MQKNLLHIFTWIHKAIVIKRLTGYKIIVLKYKIVIETIQFKDPLKTLGNIAMLIFTLIVSMNSCYSHWLSSSNVVGLHMVQPSNTVPKSNLI